VSPRADRTRTKTRGATRGRTRTGTRSRTGTGGSFDSQFSSGSEGLTNARTRLVGSRTGVLAEAVVAIVRFSHVVRDGIRRVAVRVSAVVTPLGWFIAVLTPVAFVAGYALGWVELIVLAWASLVLTGLAAVYLIGRSALDITLGVVTSRVVVGESAAGQITVKNPLGRRVLGTKVEVPVGEGLADLALPSLAAHGEFVHEFPIATTRRGLVRIGPVRTVRADPIGLVRRELVWTDLVELFVHPRTTSIPSMSTGLIRDLEGNPTRDLSTSDIAFHALREYQHGDERRSIHWKSTAKTGRYMVRQFEETRRSHLVIALSLADGDFANDDEFEMAVSVAGSLGVRALRDTRDVTVAVSEATPEFAKRKVFAIKALSTLTRTRLLDDLAVVQKAPTALTITDVARVSAEKVIGVSVAFLICGSTVTPAQLRAASVAFPTGVEVVAIVCDPVSVPGLRRVNGLSVITIGFLEELRKALARSAAL